MQNYQIDCLRENLISLDGKSFGKTFEIIVTRLQDLEKASDTSHDRYCKKTENKIEIKSSRALHKVVQFTESNIADYLLNKQSAKTLVPDDKKCEYDWDCGICQVKTNCFDVLYYAVVFFDKVYIMKITKEQIKADKEIGFSNKQHRDGKMGQFHINAKNIQHHINNYLYKSLNYQQLIAILKFQA